MAIERESQRIGNSFTPKQGFRFRVTIAESNAGSPVNYSPRDAVFTRVGALRGSLNVVESPSGAQGAPEKFPTGLVYQDITLERGATNKLDLMNWFNEAALAGSGAVSGGRYKREVVISELDREGFAINRWLLVDAFPTEYSVRGYDGSSNAFLIQRLRLAYRIFLPQAISSSRVPPRPDPDILDVFAGREDHTQSRFTEGQTSV